ncbi:MAG TPA: hypothetical protein VIX86_20420 [Streptosporangiaceae bacterium]
MQTPSRPGTHRLPGLPGRYHVPSAPSRPAGYAPGIQAGEAAIRQEVTDAGFTRFRRAAETPFKLV